MTYHTGNPAGRAVELRAQATNTTIRFTPLPSCRVCLGVGLLTTSGGIHVCECVKDLRVVPPVP